MLDADHKKCNSCLETKPLSKFGVRKANGKEYLRTCGRPCDNRKRDDRRKKSGTTYTKSLRRLNAKRSQMRKSGAEPERWILQDSRGSDKKANRENDLTKEFIAEQIAGGCLYCGESGIRMTLDRIDNSKGHLMDNVVPACIRCNYTRKNMPHEAWLVVAPGMREARVAGLFKGWTGRCR